MGEGEGKGEGVVVNKSAATYAACLYLCTVTVMQGFIRKSLEILSVKSGEILILCLQLQLVMWHGMYAK